MKSIKFDGTVFTGEGDGRKYLSLPWVKQQLEERLGYIPYLGTLNLKLRKENADLRKKLLEAKSTAICPAEGYCVGLLFKASVKHVECAVIVPQVNGYPDDVLEVISASNLRETLKLKDGDFVSILIQV